MYVNPKIEKRDENFRNLEACFVPRLSGTSLLGTYLELTTKDVLGSLRIVLSCIYLRVLCTSILQYLSGKSRFLSIKTLRIVC